MKLYTCPSRNEYRVAEFKQMKFSDGCWHVELPDTFKPIITEYHTYSFNICYEHEDDPVLLLMLKSAIRNAVPNKKAVIDWTIEFDFLPYARQDRVCSAGQSDALDVFLSLISEPHLVNSGAEFVHIIATDVHSEQNTIILANKYKIGFMNRLEYGQLKRHISPDFIVSPDKGAIDRAGEAQAQLRNRNQLICFEKKRDPATGQITLIVPVGSLPEDLTGKKCLIIDDICDGGGTFLPIAAQLKERGALVYLYVTHGIFSKGIDIFKDFEKVFVTNCLNNSIIDQVTVVKY